MLKKFFMALLIAAASFNFVSTSEAADAENYCCGNYYNNDCCYGDGNYDNGFRGGRCCR